MRTDPITKEKFEPANENHIFASKESFLTFIHKIDPMDEFVPVQRHINWEPQQRKDPITGETFIATHPAQRYAPRDDE